MTKTKKLFSLAMAFFMTLNIVCFNAEIFSASADAVTNPATNLIFDTNTGTITGYTGDPTDLDIPAKINNVTVKAIGNDAFYNCNTLKKVTIPDGVTDIGKNTFSFCSSLVSVSIPDSVGTIGACSFEYCTSLAQLALPDGVTSVGYDAFYSCTSLTTVTIPKSMISFSYSFGNCTALTSIIIPKGTVKISSNEFVDCTSLTSITIPDGVTSIGGSAFLGCTSLKAITIPGSVATIGDNAFADCTSLASANISDGITSIGSDAFSFTSLISVVIPKSVTSIGNDAFSQCTSLKTVEIPASTTNLGTNIFDGSGKVTVCCSPGSAAQSYAQNSGISTADISKMPESITVKSPPAKLSYMQGDPLNLTGTVITANYNDGTKADINVTDSMVSGYNSNIVGSQIITVTYMGLTAAFTVTVSGTAKTVTGISIKSTPTKTSYATGQRLDLNGAVITVKYKDGTSDGVTVTDSMVSGYNSNNIGSQIITVTYMGLTAAFTVTVSGTAKTVTGISMKSNPTETSYTPGLSLDLTGALITVRYSDGSSADIAVTSTMVSGYDDGKIGSQLITVTYEGKTTNFTVTVDADKAPTPVISGVKNGGFYNRDVKIVFSNAETTLNGNPFKSGTTVSAQGRYTLVATNSAGLAITLSFTIDKTPPTISASVKNGGYSPSKVSVSCSDANIGAISVTLNGKAIRWPDNGVFSADGAFKITAADKAGNISAYRFIIDRLAPLISAKKTNKKVIKNNGFSNTNVTVAVSDAALSAKWVKHNGKTVLWPSKSVFTAEGKYIIAARDRYNRVSKLAFVIDKTPPKITVKNRYGKAIASGGYTLGLVYINCSEKYVFHRSISRNGHSILWPSGGKKYIKGKYLIIATDKAGNKASFIFLIK